MSSSTEQPLPASNRDRAWTASSLRPQRGLPHVDGPLGGPSSYHGLWPWLVIYLHRRPDSYRLERPSCRVGIAPTADKHFFPAHISDVPSSLPYGFPSAIR